MIAFWHDTALSFSGRSGLKGIRKSYDLVMATACKKQPRELRKGGVIC